MEDLIKFISENLWIVQLGAIVTALGILWQKVFKPIYDWISKVRKVVTELEIGYPILEEIVREFSRDGKCIVHEKFEQLEHDMWLRRERHRIYQELDEAAIFETDETGDYLWVSEGWMNLVGQNMVEASGYGWLAGVNSLDRDRISNEWLTAQKQKRQFKMKFRIRENGKTRWVRCTALPVKDKEGNVYCYIGKLIELTEYTQLDINEVLKP